MSVCEETSDPSRVFSHTARHPPKLPLPEWLTEGGAPEGLKVKEKLQELNYLAMTHEDSRNRNLASNYEVQL